MIALAPVRLEGRHVLLEPLAMDHAAALFAAADDPELFRYLPDRLTAAGDHRVFVERALADHAQGKALPFAVRMQRTGEIVGTTRFGAVEMTHRRAEIGWTWLSRAAQRTAVNTECKRLLLGHGFDALHLNRIELKTDALNQASRAAIARIGAQQEGIFRQHMVMPDGRVRDTVYFSIVRSDWPAVRSALDARLSVAR